MKEFWKLTTSDPGLALRAFRAAAQVFGAEIPRQLCVDAVKPALADLDRRSTRRSVIDAILDAVEAIEDNNRATDHSGPLQVGMEIEIFPSGFSLSFGSGRSVVKLEATDLFRLRFGLRGEPEEYIDPMGGLMSAHRRYAAAWSVCRPREEVPPRELEVPELEVPYLYRYFDGDAWRVTDDRTEVPRYANFELVPRKMWETFPAFWKRAKEM